MILSDLEKILGDAFKIACGIDFDWLGYPLKVRSYPRAYLSIANIRHVGHDVLEAYENDPVIVGKEVGAFVHGERVVTWRVQIENTSPKPSGHPVFLSEKFRAGMRSRRVVELLRSKEVGLNEIGSTVMTRLPDRDRNTNVANIDVLLNVRSEIEDCDNTVIDTVEITSTISDDAGNIAPIQIQPPEEEEEP